MDNTENKTKQKPDLYIFIKDAGGQTTNIGAAFKHAKGNGYNIVIGKDRFVAFPPKPKTPEPGEGA